MADIFGTKGKDVQIGTDEGDTFFWSAGADFIDGGDGLDTVDYSDSPHGVYIDMFFTVEPFVQAQNINKGVHTGTGVPASDHGQGTPPPQKNTGQDTLVNVERIIGSEHSDTLVGVEGGTFEIGGESFTASATTELLGMGGNDSIQTLPGGFADNPDTEEIEGSLTILLDGGIGNDLIFATGFIDLPGPDDNLNPLLAGAIELHATMLGGNGDDVLVADIATESSTFDMTGGDGADEFRILLGLDDSENLGLFNGYGVTIQDFNLDEGDALVFDDYPISGPDFSPAKLAGVGGGRIDTDPVTIVDDADAATFDIIGNVVDGGVGGDLAITFEGGGTLTLIGLGGLGIDSFADLGLSFVSGPDMIPNNVNAG